VKPGQRVVVSELVNTVFTAPEERAALDRLFKAFFKLPLVAAQQQERLGRPPSLAELDRALGFRVPGTSAVLLAVMESDPRTPRFLERDPKSGEIVRVDVAAVRADPRFAGGLERGLATLEGQPRPALQATGYDGKPLAAPSGQPHVVYFSFTDCAPCLQTAPVLHELAAARGVAVVALNADRVLELSYDDAARAAYAHKLPGFRFAHASQQTVRAFGGVSVFPTLFFVSRDGTVVKQLVNRQERAALEAALDAASK
jgi:thiol-disulfide isomerase/thioredoxin